MNKLLNYQNQKKSRMYYCRYFLHRFIWKDLLQNHQPHCSQHCPQHIEVPDNKNSALFLHKQLKEVYVIYADFKSLTKKDRFGQTKSWIVLHWKIPVALISGVSYILVSKVANTLNHPSCIVEKMLLTTSWSA